VRKVIIPLLAVLSVMSSVVVNAESTVFTDSDASALMSKAKEGGISPDLQSLMSKMQAYKPKDAIYLPTGGLYLFEDANSKLMAVTTNGRYTLSGGSLVDVVKRTQLFKVDEIRKSYFISLSDSPFPLNKVASIPLGNPKLKRQAAIFITLDCDGCEDLIKKFVADREKYRVDIVLIPSPGEPKKQLQRLWCSREKGKITDFDIIQWLTGNKADTEKRWLPVKESESCSVEPLVTSMALAGVYNLQGVPSVVREDGLAGNGIPKDFDYWLKQSVTPLLKNPFATN
jgi:hypothetical protein